MRTHLIVFLFIFSLNASFAQYYDNDLLSKEFHASRREALRNLLSSNSCAVFFSNPEQKRANDTRFIYHQDPDFYYLTGLNEPNSVLIVFKESQLFSDGRRGNELIFVQDRNPLKECWTGRILGKEGVKNKLGFDHPFLNDELPGFDLHFESLDRIYFSGTINACEWGNEKDSTTDVNKMMRSKIHSYSVDKVNKKTLPVWMATLREIKQPEELVLMRKAIDISCAAHLELMKALQPQMHEYEAQAVIEYMFKKEGAEYVGYPSIVGGAENSCILHYETNRRKLEGKDLLVIDAGAEYHGYTADITRTLPVNGSFSKEEKIIYDIVLQAQEQGIRACKAGNDFRAAHNTASQIIQNKLLELKIIKRKEDYTTYFFHGTSHYLGLDVHDAGNYGKLVPGNIITVEPGIYIPAGSPCDRKWWNIGIRIEDDILITETEPENLSGKLPRSTEAIEAIMKQESLFNKIK